MSCSKMKTTDDLQYQELQRDLFLHKKSPMYMPEKMHSFQKECIHFKKKCVFKQKRHIYIQKSPMYVPKKDVFISQICSNRYSKKPYFYTKVTPMYTKKAELLSMPNPSNITPKPLKRKLLINVNQNSDCG